MRQYHNPGLQAAWNRWQAALERGSRRFVRLPDPRFNYRYFIENVETRVGPQRQAFGLSQTFPWFGKLELRGGVASRRLEAPRREYEAEKLKLFFKVKKAYSRILLSSPSDCVVRENLELVKYLEKCARHAFKAAEASTPDVIRAQVELGKLDDRLLTLEDLRGPMVARLNALLNRPTQAPLPWPKTDCREPDRRLTKISFFDWLHKNNPNSLRSDTRSLSSENASASPQGL